MQTIILGILRHLLTGLGGAAVTKGYLSADDSTAAIGAILTLAGIAWSVWNKFHPAPPVAPPQGNGNLTRLPLVLCLLTSVLCSLTSACAFKVHEVKLTPGPGGTNSITSEWTKERLWQGYAVTIVERGFGIDVGVSTANQTPKVKAGWFSSSVRYTPTSTNTINIPRMADSMAIGNSVSPFSLNIEEDFMSGDLQTSSNTTNWTATAITPGALYIAH